MSRTETIGDVSITWSKPDVESPLNDLPDSVVQDRERHRGRPSSNGVSHPLEAFGTRDEILEWLGHLARVGMTDKEYLAALRAAHEAGRIVDLDDSRPWTDEDLQVLATEAAKWTQGEDLVRLPEIRFVKKRHEPREDVERINAAELIEMDLPPLEYVVETLMPTGLGIVSGAPKIGKSWLVLQSAIEIATGGELLGYPVSTPRPVRYYALEDGKQRLQGRLRQLKGGRSIDVSLLEFVQTAPRIGDGLDEEIVRFLDDNDNDCVVIIDVWAMVRPPARGRGSAYDDDYSAMKPLRDILQGRPRAAIINVTHDRKAGSEDWLTTVTGTRGVTGSVDWAWVLKRPRLKLEGVVNITGRDVYEQSIDATFAGAWTATGVDATGKSDPQDDILDALRTEGDLTTKALVHYLHPETKTDANEYDNRRSAASEKLNKLFKRGIVSKSEDPAPTGGKPRTLWHVLSDDEIAAQVAAVRSQAIHAMPTHVKVNRVRRQRTTTP